MAISESAKENLIAVLTSEAETSKTFAAPTLYTKELTQQERNSLHGLYNKNPSPPFSHKNSHNRNTILSTGCIIKTSAAIGHTQPEGANL